MFAIAKLYQMTTPIIGNHKHILIIFYIFLLNTSKHSMPEHAAIPVATQSQLSLYSFAQKSFSWSSSVISVVIRTFRPSAIFCNNASEIFSL